MVNSNFGVLFLKRLIVFVKVAFSLLFKEKIQTNTGFVVRLNGPKRFKLFLETMGGSFIKLGQVLMLYQEVLPGGYAQELMGLKNKAIELSFRTMNNVFFDETGRWLEDLFVDLDKKPMASTVTAQIYKGQLHDGTVVTVKIQRPYVKEIFEADFGVISLALHFFGFLGLLPMNKINEILAYFVSWTRKSLNFITEAKNADILYQHNLKHSSSIIPKQYLEYCTKRVLVQEFIHDAASLEDVIKYKKEKSELVGEEFDPIGIIECFINDELREYFIDGFFHASPHPSNMVFTENYTTVHLDFGIIGNADSRRIVLLRVLSSLAQKDADGFCKHLFEFGDKILQDEMEDYLKADLAKRRQEEKILEKIKNLIFEDFKKDAAEILNNWFLALDNPDSDPETKLVVYPITKILRKLSTYGIYLPRETNLFLRALFLLDTVGSATSDAYNLVNSLNSFFSVHFVETLERYIVSGEHSKEVTSKLISLTELDWEFFKESSLSERERIMAARERISEIIYYYSEHYEEIGSMIKKIR